MSFSKPSYARKFLGLLAEGVICLLLTISFSKAPTRAQQEPPYGVSLYRDGQYYELGEESGVGLLAFPGRKIPYTTAHRPTIFVNDISQLDTSHLILRSLEKGGNIAWSGASAGSTQSVNITPVIDLPPDQYCLVNLPSEETWCFEVVSDASYQEIPVSFPPQGFTAPQDGDYLYEDGNLVGLKNDLKLPGSTPPDTIHQTFHKNVLIVVRGQGISWYQTYHLIDRVDGEIGSQVNVEQGKLVFTGVNQEYSDAGVKLGDVLTKIDGASVDVEGARLDSALLLSTGLIESPMALTLQRAGTEITVTVRRVLLIGAPIQIKYTQLDAVTGVLQPDTLAFGMYCIATEFENCFEIIPHVQTLPQVAQATPSVIPQVNATSSAQNVAVSTEPSQAGNPCADAPFNEQIWMAHGLMTFRGSGTPVVVYDKPGGNSIGVIQTTLTEGLDQTPVCLDHILWWRLTTGSVLGWVRESEDMSQVAKNEQSSTSPTAVPTEENAQVLSLTPDFSDSPIAEASAALVTPLNLDINGSDIPVIAYGLGDVLVKGGEAIEAPTVKKAMTGLVLGPGFGLTCIAFGVAPRTTNSAWNEAMKAGDITCAYVALGSATIALTSATAGLPEAVAGAVAIYPFVTNPDKYITTVFRNEVIKWTCAKKVAMAFAQAILKMDANSISLQCSG